MENSFMMEILRCKHFS